MSASDLQRLIRDIPDVPTPGVMFRDITPLLADPVGYDAAVNAIVGLTHGKRVDKVIGIEARGFIMAAPVAFHLNAGFIPVRKAGKLPWAVVREEYSLEYGTDQLEIHRDALKPGESVVIVDDVLATGGTAKAAVRLVEGLGATVAGLVFLVELPALGGRQTLSGHSVSSVITY
ncbi:MAG: adenine phosphoribosyltransferase [Actinobacteria bacterium]|nr:adenine phosphoribosyltransferase [Actinomycetota bacterium]NBP53015.1 adenine phosphoribosyltransferase [Actinomycetota bacterium]